MTGQELREMREKRKWSRKELGAKAGYVGTPGQRIANYENGHKNMSSTTAVLLRLLLTSPEPTPEHAELQQAAVA